MFALLSTTAQSKRVTTSLIWFWNAGRRPILRQDIPAAQPLSVSISDPEKQLEILDVKVTKVSRPAIAFSASKTADTALDLSFDFLDHGDGALIEVQHTGTVFSRVEASGVILGAAEGIRLMQPFSRMFATYPGGTLMSRIQHPMRDRLFRATFFLVWLGVVWVWVRQTWFVSSITISVAQLRTAVSAAIPRTAADSLVTTIVRHGAKPSLLDKIGLGMSALITLYILYANLRALTRPLYSIPRSLAPDTDTAASVSTSGTIPYYKRHIPSVDT